MKKFILASLALCLSLCGYARTLTPAEALTRAQLSGDVKRAPGQSAYRLIEEGPAYFIFSNQTSALILGADDQMVPVLGYLDTPVTAETVLPEQLQWWLAQADRELQWALAHPAKPAVPHVNFSLAPKAIGQTIIPQMRRTEAAKQDISPLLKTTWNQTAPYNNLCPTGMPTGCVATAMAQAMKYHAYPTKGTGTVSTTYNNSTLSMDLDNTTFQWAQMRNDYSTGTATATQKTAVATLMKACGYSVKMQYASGGSGALTQDIVPAMVNNFKYANSILLDYRDFYSLSDWSDKVYAELLAGRPLIYGGSGTDGGHQFVCDGYRASDGYFHFNWGWGGNSDGYFSLTYLVPEAMGTGGNSDGFTYEQDAIFGLATPEAGLADTPGYIGIYYGTLTAAVDGNRFITLSFGTAGNSGLWNLSGKDIESCDIGYTLTNSSGTTTQYTIQANTAYPAYGGISSIPVSIPTSVADGEYTLALDFKVKGYDWEPVRINYGSPKVVRFTLSGKKITSCKVEATEEAETPDVPVTAEITYSNMAITSALEVGGSSTLTVDMTNSTTADYSNKLAACLLQVSGSSAQIVSTTDYQQVSVPAGKTVNGSFPFTIDSNIEAGTYYLAIIDETPNIQVYAEVSVAAAGGGGSGGTVTGEMSYEATDASDFYVGQPYNVTFAITNGTSDAFSQNLGAVILFYDTTAGAYYLASTAEYQNVTLASGASGSYTFNGTISNQLEAGQHILAIANDQNKILSAWYVDVKAYDGPVAELALSDLQPLELTLGQEATVSFTVSNSGTGAYSGSIECYLGNVDTIDYFAVGSKTTTIAAGGSEKFTFTTTLPATVPSAQNYFLSVWAGADLVGFSEVTLKDQSSITEVEGAANAAAPIYDLLGRRLQKAPTGLYIQNGQKVRR